MPKKSYPLRIEEIDFLKLQKIAKVNHRSANGQIEFLIEKAIKEYEDKNGEIEINPDEFFE